MAGSSLLLPRPRGTNCSPQPRRPASSRRIQSRSWEPCIGSICTICSFGTCATSSALCATFHPCDPGEGLREGRMRTHVGVPADVTSSDAVVGVFILRSYRLTRSPRGSGRLQLPGARERRVLSNPRHRECRDAAGDGDYQVLVCPLLLLFGFFASKSRNNTTYCWSRWSYGYFRVSHRSSA